MDSIFILINHIENPSKKQSLITLMKQHEEVILASDIIVKDKMKIIDKMDFVPWLMIKNTGRGI